MPAIYIAIASARCITANTQGKKNITGSNSNNIGVWATFAAGQEGLLGGPNDVSAAPGTVSLLHSYQVTATRYSIYARTQKVVQQCSS